MTDAVAPGGSRWRRVWRRVKLTLLLLSLLTMALIAALVWYEGNTSRLQAHFLSDLAREMSYSIEPGTSDAIRFPGRGPFDQRLGYGNLPQFLPRLTSRNYVITDQVRISPRMAEIVDEGLFAPYHEKTQAGLALLDCTGDTLFRARYPERVYEKFESVPDLLTQSLLFIENRELLDTDYATKNPAVEWDRFAKAVIDQVIHKVDPDHEAPGGSTLATQIEKYRHSPEGRTTSGTEKLRQMASASLRAYLGGEDTTPVRRQLVVDYLNTVPLAAKPGYGEVIGIGDGMWAWYGREFDEVNALLGNGQVDPMARALAYKQALSLMISQRRPTGFLADQTALENLTNTYLRLMSNAGLIAPELRDAALAQQLKLQRDAKSAGPFSYVSRKAANAARTHLAALLGTPRLYDLDRLDLSATSTLDAHLQRIVTEALRSISDPAVAKEAGLMGEHLLGGADPGKIIYSFTLYERTAGANVVRVQTDNYDQPFDINEGTKLDLGSTAKLRTLVTYLELVSRLHSRLVELPPEELAKVPVARQDAITRWAVDYLKTAQDHTLKAMLDASMERTYSANPGEQFFTGGGLLTFENFDDKDNNRIVSVREGLQRSVNLLFIRLMRDIVRHTMFNMPSSSATLLDDDDDPKRREYLARFADREGTEFIVRFYKKYQGKTAPEAETLLLQGIRPTPKRLATIFRSLDPDAGQDKFADFIDRNLPDAAIEPSTLSRLYQDYSPQRYDLADRGYLAGVHPLELWLVGYLRSHPGANLSQTIEASAAERQNVYRWLFKTRYKSAQDSRIKQLVEVEAFLEIHKMWKRVGYPFDSLVPSYATALGSSADRPAALAELMGILVNDGVRLPTLRLDQIAFAGATPYETRLAYRSAGGERVLPSEVARVARETLALVVEGGTAKRLRGVFTRPDGSPITVGGKTGTGDHRFETYGRGGVLLSSRVVSRSGTFVFYIGDRHFGTLTAYVKGPEAAQYKFTSALPSQIIKVLAPTLLGEVNREAKVGTTCAADAPALPKEALKPASDTPIAPPDAVPPKDDPAAVPSPDSAGTPPGSAIPAPAPSPADAAPAKPIAESEDHDSQPAPALKTAPALSKTPGRPAEAKKAAASKPPSEVPATDSAPAAPTEPAQAPGEPPALPPADTIHVPREEGPSN